MGGNLSPEPPPSGNPFEKYQDDPTGFIREVLGESITDDVAVMCESVRDHTATLAKSANGTGKCLAYGETLVLADGTPVRVEDLIGKSFEVWSVDEHLNRKRSAAYATDNGVEPVVRIKTQSGREILRTLNHPLMSADSRFASGMTPVIGPRKWVPAGDLKPGDIVLMIEESPAQGQHEMRPEHIRLLAYLIGDGSLEAAAVKFSKMPGKVLDEFRADVEAIGCHLVKIGGPDNQVDWKVTATRPEGTWGRNPIHDLIRSHDLWNKTSYEKSVPRAIWQLPNDQLALFLSRLFATDGWACTGPTQKDGVRVEIGYSSVSRQLCEDIVRLLERFGIIGRVRSKKTTWTHNGEKRTGTVFSIEILSSRMCLRFCDRIGIYGKEDAVERVRQGCLQMSRQQTGWSYRDLREGYCWDKVKEVEVLEAMPTVAVTVPGDETFLTSFVEHNTHGAARLAIWYFCCFSDSQVYTACAPPLANLTKLLWGEIGKILASRPQLFEKFKITSLHIERSSSSFLTGVTIPQSGTEAQREGKFSGKHAPHLMFILDESDALPWEVYRGIESCMSGGHARLLMLFNPRAQAGPVYLKERDGLANIVSLTAFNHPNVVTGEDVYPGAVTRQTTVRRINEWTRPLHPGEKKDAECFEVPDHLAGATAMSQKGIPYPPLPAGWRRIVEPAFSYMVLARYPAQSEHQLISRVWIDAARARWDLYVAQYGLDPPFGVSPILGMDVAEKADLNAVCLRYGGYVAPIITWEGVDVAVSASRAATIYTEHGAYVAKVDATGLGAGVAPIMRRENCPNSQGIMVANSPTETTEMGSFGILRDQLWWSVREWLRTDPGAMLPPDEQLQEELAIPTYQTGKVIKVMDKETMKELLRRSPDRAESLIMTFAPDEDTAAMSVGGGALPSALPGKLHKSDSAAARLTDRLRRRK